MLLPLPLCCCWFLLFLFLLLLPSLYTPPETFLSWLLWSLLLTYIPPSPLLMTAYISSTTALLALLGPAGILYWSIWPNILLLLPLELMMVATIVISLDFNPTILMFPILLVVGGSYGIATPLPPLDIFNFPTMFIKTRCYSQPSFFHCFGWLPSYPWPFLTPLHYLHFSNPSYNPPCSNFLFPPDTSISSLDFFGNSLCLPRNSITNPCFIPRFLILLDSQITTYLLLFYFTLCCCRLFYAASPAIYFTPLSAAATVVCRTGRGLPLFSSFFHSRWSLLPPSTIVCGNITYAYSGFYIPIVVDVPLHGSHESRMTHTCA